MKYCLFPAVIRELRRQVRIAGSQVTVARWASVSPQFINDVLSAKRSPTGKLLDFLGFEKETVYIRKSQP